MKKLSLLIAILAATCNLSFGQIVNLGPGQSTAVNCSGDHVSISQPTTLQTIVNCVAPIPPPTNINMVVDHTSIPLFDQIPANFLTAAGAKKLLMRHASVGQNISDGLNCLVNNSANACRTGFEVPASSIPIVQQPQYNRANWVFEFRGNPGWYGKVNDFLTNFNTRYYSFDFISWKQSYVDDSGIYKFWNSTSLPDIFEIEAAEAAHPQTKVIFWTAAISKLPFQYIEDFNVQMRIYTLLNSLPLIDLADIESHKPDGTACTTGGVAVICPEYNIESSGGHLTNGMGQQRVAKAVWVLMARLAGWTGQ